MKINMLMGPYQLYSVYFSTLYIALLRGTSTDDKETSSTWPTVTRIVPIELRLVISPYFCFKVADTER